MMCAKFGTVMMANNDLASGGGTYESPYRVRPLINELPLTQNSHYRSYFC